MAKSDWQNVEIGELSDEQRRLYDEMKAQYRVYAGAKALFESSMQLAYGEQLGEDEELKFGYNFGKLSIAVGEKRERKPSKAASKPSLSAWLQARQESGHNS